MLRRLAVILILAATGAAFANQHCPDPFPDVWDADMYLTFPLHGHVHSIAVRDTSQPAGQQTILHIDYTRRGLTDAIDAPANYYRPAYRYRANFDAHGNLTTATFTFGGKQYGKIAWHYPNGTFPGYGDLYVRLQPRDPMSSTPNFRLVPNVSIANYGIYRHDGTLAATIEYEQGYNCSLSGLRLQFPLSNAPDARLSNLFGTYLAEYGTFSENFDFVLNAPDMYAATSDGVKPTDYAHSSAWKAVSKDAHGNVTEYLTGTPKPDFNSWTLDPKSKGVTSFDIAYTYYDSTP